MICDAGGSNANEDLDLTQEPEHNSSKESTFDVLNKHKGGELVSQRIPQVMLLHNKMN